VAHERGGSSGGGGDGDEEWAERKKIVSKVGHGGGRGRMKVDWTGIGKCLGEKDGGWGVGLDWRPRQDGMGMKWDRIGWAS
jgi:hypothetical protein